MRLSDLDRLTRAVTAFPCFWDFLDAMDAGYVPTIRPTTRRARILAKMLHAMDYRTFDGSR